MPCSAVRVWRGGRDVAKGKVLKNTVRSDTVRKLYRSTCSKCTQVMSISQPRKNTSACRIVHPNPSPSLQCHAASTTYDPITHPFQASVSTHASTFKHACAPFQAQVPPGGPLRSLLPSLAWSGPGFIPGGGELACIALTHVVAAA